MLRRFSLAMLLALAHVCAGQVAPSIQWINSLGGSGQDFAYGVIQLPDSSYVVAGFSESSDGEVTGNHGSHSSDDWIVCLDSSGNIKWQKSFGGTKFEFLRGLQPTRDGGFITVGSTESSDGDVVGKISPDSDEDVWVVKYDQLGSLQWQHTYGGSRLDNGYGIEPTADGGYVIVGISVSNDATPEGNLGERDYLILKIDSVGRQQWAHTYGGSSEDVAESIFQAGDGSYLVAGWTRSTDGDVAGKPSNSSEDYWILRLDSTGAIIWQKLYGGSLDDEAYCIHAGLNGGFILSGISNSVDGDRLGVASNQNLWVIECDDAGNILQQYNSSSLFEGFESEEAQSVEFTHDGGFVVASGGGSIHKFDHTGKFEWRKYLATGTAMYSTDARQTADSGYIVVGHGAGPHGADDYWVLKFDYVPEIYALSADTISAFCDAAGTDTIVAQNVGSKFLRVDSALIRNSAGLFSIISPVAFPQYIEPGQSFPLVLQYVATSAGSTSATVQLFSSDTMAGHSPWNISVSGHSDSVGALIREAPNDTVDFGYLACGTARDTVVTLINTSSIPASFLVQSGTSAFLSTASFFHFDSTGQSQTFGIHFAGNIVPGNYSGAIGIIDTCGRVHDIILVATVDTPRFQFSLVDDTTICPGDSIVRIIHVKNNSHIMRTLELWVSDSLYSLPNEVLQIGVGDTSTVAIVFHGAMTNGMYAARCRATTACGDTTMIIARVSVDGAAVVAQTIADTTICPNDSALQTVVLRNVSASSQTIHFLGSGSALFSVALDSLILNAGDSALVNIFFHGSPVNGIFSISYNLPAGCGNAQPLRATVRVDNGAVIASAVRDTMICPGDSIRWNVALHNVSGGAEQVQFTNSGSQFIISPDSLTLAAGDSAIVNMLFTGSQTSGAYKAFYALPGCGSVNAITANVLVHAPDIRVPYSLDTIICPFTPLVFTFPVTNADSITHTLSLDAGAGTLSKQNITLRAGQTDTLHLSLPGSPIGNDQNSIVVIDDCGAYHYITFTLDVRSAPPAILSLQTDTTSTSVGTEHNVYLLAKPYTTFESGGITLTLTNEPTALQFDSLISQCGATITRGENTNTITFAACASISSDTIATLYYNTLVGSTLTPTVTLQNVQTANTCDTVSGAGFATINLLPPGCELGTVIVHPFTSAINSIYPNPATGIATITYSTVENANVTIDIRDLLGQSVQSLVHAVHTPGVYTTNVDSDDLINGLYYLTLRVGTTLITRELLIMK